VDYLIWDFDGTLASRAGLWSQTLADVARDELAHAAFTQEHFAPYLQAGFFWHDYETPHPHVRGAEQWWIAMAPVLCGAFHEATNVSPEHARSLLPKIRAAYLDVRRWRLFADAEPCLSAVSGQGWRNVMLTNHVPELPSIVAALGLAPHFAGICNSADTGYEKPHPTAFARVREHLVGAERVWMIGDNYRADVLGARAAGIPAVLVRRRHDDAPHFHETLATLPAFFANGR
jgi:putative hydrolase of the HAD superfamily